MRRAEEQEVGELNKRILIQIDQGTARTAAGDPVEDWVTWSGLSDGYCWASIRQASGREVERAAQQQVYATHVITTRWIPGLTPVDMRATLNSRIFDFGIVENVEEANVFARITASERIA